MEIGNLFENGTISTTEKTISSGGIAYNPHTKFKGVSLKHLVTGEMTENKISCHLVHVEPNCTLELHTHPDNLEIHEVISGGGIFYNGDIKATYTAGSVGIIPANVSHKVEAGEDGIYILAKFIPALL